MRVQRAIAAGVLTREPCVVCRATPAEAHPYLGYEREHWLHVVWLCDLHHVRAHRGDDEVASAIEQVA